MVFARACGAPLTTISAKKIEFASPDCWLSEDFKWLFATSRSLSNAITATAGAEASKCFLSATIGCLLDKLRCLGAPFGSLSVGSDHQDASSSCQRLTRGCLDAQEALWRWKLAAQTMKKLLKSLQKHSRERQEERSQAEDAPKKSPEQRNTTKTLWFFIILDTRVEFFKLSS